MHLRNLWKLHCCWPFLVVGCAEQAPAEKPPSPERGSPECVLATSRIETDTTLYKSCSPYTLKQGGIDVVDTAVLTIEPGVEIRFKDGDWLEISAAFTKGAGIIARGTEAEPIVLTSQRPIRPGERSWFGLWLNEGTAAGSVVSNVIIRGGGGDNAHIKPTLVHGCLTLTDIPAGRVTLENITLENCLNAGLVLRRTQPQMTRLRVRNSAVGVLLDGVPPDFVRRDAVAYEGVATPVVEGPSSRATPAATRR